MYSYIVVNMSLIWGISLPASALIMVILTTNMDLPLFIDG